MPFVEVISSMVKMNSRKTLAVTDFDVTYLARESLSFFSCSCSAGIISSRSSAIASSDVSSPCWAFSVFIVASTLSFFSIKRLRKNERGQCRTWWEKKPGFCITNEQKIAFLCLTLQLPWVTKTEFLHTI